MKRVLLAFTLVTSLASSSAAASLTLSIKNGRVSLDAQDVTIRQILSEWARVGRTQVVNAERIMGGPVTLKFEDVAEKQALDIILRAVPGYVAAHRETFIADASVYDRILIMPTTSPVAAARPQPPQTTPGFPGFQGGTNVTQLRPGAPLSLPGMAPEPPDPAADQINDPAIAAAAAAGLVPVPAVSPGAVPVMSPLTVATDRLRQQSGGSNPPPAVAPTNPWNAPVGTAQPSLAPPTAPPAAPPTQPPMLRPQPPQADR